MTISVCLVHDHPTRSRPDWVSRLSSLCRLVEVHPADHETLTRCLKLPWIVDLRTIDRDLARTLRPHFGSAAEAPRLVAVDRGDRLGSMQAAALGATAVVPRPIEIASVLGRILGALRGPYLPDATREPAEPAPKRLGRVAPPSLESCRTASPRAVEIRVAIDKAAAILDRFSVETDTSGPNETGQWTTVTCGIVDVLDAHGLDLLLDVVRHHHMGTHQHSLLVMAIAAALGRALGLAPSELRWLALGGLLHDVGKFDVPEPILSKPGRLTEEEYEVVRGHSRAGWRVLDPLRPRLDPAVLDMVLHHHERLDGSGYPDGLVGDAIAPAVRWLSVADVFGALVERRSYRPPLPPGAALAIVDSMAAEGKLDRPAVRVLGELVDGWRRSLATPTRWGRDLPR